MHMFLLSCKECWAGSTISSWIFVMNFKHNSSLQLSKPWKVDFDGIYLARILNGNATSFLLSDSGHLQRNTQLKAPITLALKSSHIFSSLALNLLICSGKKYTLQFKTGHVSWIPNTHLLHSHSPINKQYLVQYKDIFKKIYAFHQIYAFHANTLKYNYKDTDKTKPFSCYFFYLVTP